MTNQESEIFIDADGGFGNDKDSYEVIILKQISKCAEVLSKDMTPGQIIYKESKTGTEKYTEDINEIVINHVDTLKMLLSPYLTGTEQKDNREQIKTIIEEIDNKKKEIGERNITIPGKGIVKLNQLSGLSVDSIYWRNFIDYKAKRYREIFEILVNCYNKQKAVIRELEQE